VSWIGSDEVPFHDIGMTKDTWDLLEELSEGSSYWYGAYMFVKSIQNRKLSSLTSSQRSWLTSIISSLKVELDKRSWRF